jgi:hypothetical protein
MKQSQAVEILGMSFNVDVNPEAVKLAYRRACSKYHPDKGGSTEMMQAVNEAYELLKFFSGHVSHEGSQLGYGDAMNAAINVIVGLHGLNIEICGSWVWVTGDTKTHKEAIKTAGFKWASKKCAWYFSPNVTTSSRGKYSMDTIRSKYGSEHVTRKYSQALPA